MNILLKVYTPSRNPKEAFILITFIVFAGIIGHALFHAIFLVAALIFWIQYTAIRSYLQFRKRTKRPRRTFTEMLLMPQVRFFVFTFIATVGLIGALRGVYLLGYASLTAWWLFALNFYAHYREFMKSENL